MTIECMNILAAWSDKWDLMNRKFEILNLARLQTFLTCDLKVSFESINTPRYLYSGTTCTFSPATKTSDLLFATLDLEKNIATVLLTMSFKQHWFSHSVTWTIDCVSLAAACVVFINDRIICIHLNGNI